MASTAHGTSYSADVGTPISERLWRGSQPYLALVDGSVDSRLLIANNPNAHRLTLNCDRDSGPASHCTGADRESDSNRHTNPIADAYR